MAKAAKSHYVCQSCGSVATRWAGKCAACGEWNSLVEEVAATAPLGSGLANSTKGRLVTLEQLRGKNRETPRIACTVEELDRVTGGGFVPGSALLIGGEPGIGKSTLLLQVAAAIAQKGGRAIYFSGEEAVAQVRLRAERLGLADAPVELAAETNLANILATLSAGPRPDLVIIDSIQTLWAEVLEAAPGTVSQVRAATQSLIGYAKQAGSALILVGHVTKEGSIAGPKVIEHMVDTVLYFEGERGHAFRILRAVKNRFGPTSEIGVFEMGACGLREVRNPSELFLGDRDAGAPGAAVFAGMEGTRPLLVEIQALVAPSPLGTPRRAVLGWDANRLSMLLAVLDVRCGVSLSQCDVYLNVAGGLKITEPAADLAAVAALLSSFSGAPLPSDRVYFGEISLSGALRAASHTQGRLKEAQKLGFTQAVIPSQGELDLEAVEIDVERHGHLKQLAETFSPCQ
jgi:DNA repair protein RadA/Sms